MPIMKLLLLTLLCWIVCLSFYIIIQILGKKFLNHDKLNVSKRCIPKLKLSIRVPALICKNKKPLLLYKCFCKFNLIEQVREKKLT